MKGSITFAKKIYVFFTPLLKHSNSRAGNESSWVAQQWRCVTKQRNSSFGYLFKFNTNLKQLLCMIHWEKYCYNN